MTELTDNSRREGAGPFRFETPSDLSPNESYSPDLRERTFQGTKRGLQRFLPFSTLSVSNANASNRLLVEVNGGVYEFGIFPNTTEVFDRQGVSAVRVVNNGSSDIPAGDVEIEVSVEPYGADQQAREQSAQGPIQNTVENVTGLDVSGFLGGG